ncbi:hypothetical protein JCM10212_003024 [Sporobolomyces blumeae]
MSTSGGKTKSATQPHRVSSSIKAGLQFPVARIRRELKKGHTGTRVGPGAAVYMAAVLEYLVAEVLELAGNAATDNRKKRIIPRYILLAVKHDEELNRLLGHVTISQGGVLPGIHRELLPKTATGESSKKKKKKSKKTTDADEESEEQESFAH